MEIKEAHKILQENDVDPFEYMDASVDNFEKMIIDLAEEIKNKKNNGEN